MKKDFTKGMIQDVKFFVPLEYKDLIMPFLDSINVKYRQDIENNIDCRTIYHVGYFSTYQDRILSFSTLYDFQSSKQKLVSMFEAVPELVPEGMRYNKELDKLVPDAIGDFKPKEQSVVDWAKENINPNIVAFDDVEMNKNEYCFGIKLESEKIVDITLEDKEILTALRQSGKSYLEIINLIKHTDTFTPSYYGAKCKCGEKLDAYAICDKYLNEHKTSAWHHAVKKLLRAGDGHKPLLKDIDEVIDSLKRWKEQLNAK